MDKLKEFINKYLPYVDCMTQIMLSYGDRELNPQLPLEVGDLELRHIQKVQSKVMDCWQGPYLVQEIMILGWRL
jgi:hypothetical protein